MENIEQGIEKRYQQLLQEKEVEDELLRRKLSTFDSFSFFILYISTDLHVESCNDAFRSFFFNADYEISREKILNFIVREDQSSLLYSINKVLQEKIGVGQVVVRMFGDKTPLAKWVNWEFKPVLNQEGGVMNILGLGYEFSESADMQKELVTVNLKLDALIRSIDDMVFEIDEQFRIINFWAMEESRLFLPPSEFIGKTLAEMFPEEYIEQFIPPLQQALSGDIPEIIRYKHLSEEEWFECRMTPIYKYIGDSKTVLVMVRDVTEKVRTDRKLTEQKQKNEQAIKKMNASLERKVEERSRELKLKNEELQMEIFHKKEAVKELEKAYRNVTAYQQALDNSATVAYTNAKGDLIYINDSFCKISGYNRDELLGKNPRLLKSGVHSREYFTELWQTIVSGKVWKGEICNRAKDGSLHWLDTTILPFLNESGEPFQYMAIRFDITAQKQAQKKLEEALEKEKELNELKTGFVNTASHQFKTPLTTIQSSLDILWGKIEKIEIPHRSRFEKHFQKMEFSIERITSLLNDVLVLGRIESGRLPYQPEFVDIAHLFKKVIDENFSDMPDGRKIYLTIRGKPRNAYIDENHFRNIFNNLISNAFKYSQGKPEPQAFLHFNNNYIKIIIKDFGIGIPDEERSKIFSSFFRASNTDGIEGTGLGLVIAKQMLETNHGDIDFYSIPGEETGFEITLEEKISGKNLSC